MQTVTLDNSVPIWSVYTNQKLSKLKSKVRDRDSPVVLKLDSEHRTAVPWAMSLRLSDDNWTQAKHLFHDICHLNVSLDCEIGHTYN